MAGRVGALVFESNDGRRLCDEFIVDYYAGLRLLYLCGKGEEEVLCPVAAKIGKCPYGVNAHFEYLVWMHENIRTAMIPPEN